MSLFKFKEFDVEQEGCAQKVGTDSMVLGAFVTHDHPEKILDVGTGNGVIALMMAQKFKSSKITGIEIQEACCSVARSNFENSIFKNRLELLNADFNNFNSSEKFDLILSNPPFFENATLSSNNARSISRHQSSLKLFDLVSIAAGNLSENGALWIVVPKENTVELISGAEKSGIKLFRRISVYGKPQLHKRDILAFVKTEKGQATFESIFTIRSNEGLYTDEYKAKTLEFHYPAL